MDDMSVFSLKFKVYANEVDANKKIKLTSMLDYLQNTAWYHYNEFEKKYGKLFDDNFIWAVTKFKLNIYKYPLWQENIKVKTWVPGVDKLFAYRNFEITDEADKLLCQSTFNWVIIDLNLKKPVPPDNFTKKWKFYNTGLFYDLKGKLEKVKNPEFTKEIKVAYSDIDVNNHVNNVKYIQWMIDCMDYNILINKQIKEIEANFLSEAFISDELIIFCQKISENPLTYLSEIVRKDSSKNIARCKFILM